MPGIGHGPLYGYAGIFPSTHLQLPADTHPSLLQPSQDSLLLAHSPSLLVAPELAVLSLGPDRAGNKAQNSNMDDRCKQLVSSDPLVFWFPLLRVLLLRSLAQNMSSAGQEAGSLSVRRCYVNRYHPNGKAAESST